MLVAVLHWLSHVTGCDYGLPYGHFAWYNLYSGFAASYPWLILGGIPAWWYHNTCHDSLLCLRWGRYPAAGGTFRLCRFHHPDLEGARPHRDLIRRLHAEHKARTR